MRSFAGSGVARALHDGRALPEPLSRRGPEASGARQRRSLRGELPCGAHGRSAPVGLGGRGGARVTTGGALARVLPASLVTTSTAARAYAAERAGEGPGLRAMPVLASHAAAPGVARSVRSIPSTAPLLARRTCPRSGWSRRKSGSSTNGVGCGSSCSRTTTSRSGVDPAAMGGRADEEFQPPAGGAGDLEDQLSRRVRRAPLFGRLRDAGLYLVYMGLESGNEAGLSAHKQIWSRPIPSRGDLEVLGLLVEYGFMLFDPSSTFDSVRDNVEFLRAILPDGSGGAMFCRMLPYGGTPIRDRLRDEGRLRGDVRSPIMCSRPPA